MRLGAWAWPPPPRWWSARSSRVGIFLTPAAMARTLGSPFWLLVVWLLMGGMALCGALAYGELAARFPEAGGGYVYLREAYGPPARVPLRLEVPARHGPGHHRRARRRASPRTSAYLVPLASGGD